MSDLKLDFQRTTVIVIDLQKGIVGRSCAPHSASTVIANTVRVLAGARQAGALIVLVHVGGAPMGPTNSTRKPISRCPVVLFLQIGQN